MKPNAGWRIASWPLLIGMLALAACQGREGTSTADATPTPTPRLVLGRIVGIVLLEGQKDAGGIQVYVPGSQRLALTDEAGHFTLDNVEPGPYKLMARAEGFDAAEVGAVTVEPSSVARDYSTPSLTLKSKLKAKGAAGALGSVNGKITAAAGAGPADWTRCVVQLENTPYRTTCGADGAFLLWSLPADDYTLQVTLTGFETASARVRVLPGQQTEAPAIRLKAVESNQTRRILGFVELLTADGAPSNDFDKITVGLVGQPGVTAHLAADGKFLLDKLAPAKHLVTAWGAGYGQVAPIEVDLTELPEMEVQITLTASAATSTTAGATLRGVALKHVSGLVDMSGITIALAGTGKMAVTDADGHYTINGIAPGAYQIVAQASGFKSAQQGPLTLRAGDTLDAEGMLLDPDLNYPVVLATTPGDGARDVTIKREIPVTVRFSKKMVPETLRKAVRIEPPIAFRVYTGRDQLDSDFDLLRIVMYGTGEQPPATFDTNYKITISTEASDFEGLSLQEPFEMSLRTGEPAVIGTLPADGGVMNDMMSGQPVVIYFNAALDHASLTPDVLRIRPTQTVLPALRAQEDPLTGWTALYLTANWTPDTKYEITVQRRARTTGKNPLSNTPFTFSFRTAGRMTLPLNASPFDSSRFAPARQR